ncbi:unnamed protein product, partial [Rotaria magnacalcarata]
STFSYPSSHSQPPNAHTNFSSTTNPSSTASFGQIYYPPTPPKDLLHDPLPDLSNKQQQQQQQHHHHNISPTTNSSAYHSQHNWGHVLKDSSLLWS